MFPLFSQLVHVQKTLDNVQERILCSTLQKKKNFGKPKVAYTCSLGLWRIKKQYLGHFLFNVDGDLDGHRANKANACRRQHQLVT